jgi:rRNA small subunit pseudouridine methyltransferase Nep1
MLHLILVEAALETVPPAIAGHPAVRRNAKRRGKRPEEVLLNRSLHHRAMEGLLEGHKRGRPDIAHFCLLEALGSPLNRTKGLRTWVHTYGGYSIEVSPEARLPRDCNRFNSLIEQLFSEGRVPPEGGGALMTSRPMGLADLLKEIDPTHTVALTSHGEVSSLEEVCRALSAKETPAVLIGAFPHGPMSEETLSLADEAKSIYHEPLEAWVVTSRLIYEYERSFGVTMKIESSS